MNITSFLLIAYAVFLPMYKDIANIFVILFVLFSLFILKKEDLTKGWMGLKEYEAVKPVLLFYLVLLCLIPFSTSIKDSIKEFYHYISAVVPFLLLLMLKPFKEKYKIHTVFIKNAFFIGVFFASLYTIVQFLFTHQLGVSGFFGNRAFLGFVLEIAIPLVLACIFQIEQQRYKIGYIGMLFIFLTALLISQVRGAWLGVLGGGGAVVYLNRDIFNKRKAVISIIGVLLFASLMMPLYVDRGKTIIDMGFSTNANRVEIWKYTWEIILDYPLTGVGLGRFQHVFSQYVEPSSLIYNNQADRFAPHAHNAYLMIWAVSGVGGIISFLYLLRSFFKTLWRSFAKSPCATSGIIGMLLAILITSFVDNTFFAAYSYKLFWLMYGLYLYDN